VERACRARAPHTLAAAASARSLQRASGRAIPQPGILHAGPLRPASDWPPRACQAERKPDGLWNGADALVIDSGALNEDEVYSKSAALQIWLLGIEFTNTIIVICSRSIHILTDAKKVTLLSPLMSAENATIPLELHVKDKTDKFKAKFAALVSAIRSSHAGAAVAFLMKEKPQGEFSAQWRAALKDEEGLQQVELAPALARVQASKDADEQARPSHARGSLS
jgi:nucleosome binding factor SPN SPT16 subunit